LREPMERIGHFAPGAHALPFTTQIESMFFWGTIGLWAKPTLSLSVASPSQIHIHTRPNKEKDPHIRSLQIGKTSPE
jgi:hypothetical protein